MLTWRLWRALRHPPRNNPIFERIANGPYVPLHRYGYAIWLVIFPFLFCGGFSLVRDINGLYLLFAVLQLYFLYIGAHSLTWALNVSSAIAQEHEQNTHDLLCVSPPGAARAYWAIYTGCLHRKKEFMNFNNETTWMIRFLFAIPTVFASTLWMESRSARGDEQLLLYFITLILAFYIDQIQSILLGSLVGMVVPTYLHSRFDTRLFVLASFLILQLMSYLFTWLIGFVTLSAIFDALPQSTWIAVSVPMLRLAIFFLVRESLLRVLWRVLGQRVNASPAELDSMTALGA